MTGLLYISVRKTFGSTVALESLDLDVREGELIAEILVEKATMELYAPASGTLRIGVEAEDVIERGKLLASIN